MSKKEEIKIITFNTLLQDVDTLESQVDFYFDVLEKNDLEDNELHEELKAITSLFKTKINEHKRKVISDGTT